MKLRFQPIRVFCFHHVSEVFNPLTMWECDWTQIDQFKSNIRHLKEQGYAFISLIDAYEKLKHDSLRRKKYIVLTADDGYKSILSILPWLEEQLIPITLFINTKYLDGKSWSAINEEQARRANPNVDMLKVCSDLYMSKDELFSLTSPLISIGMHGHEHLDATQQSQEEFKQNVELCREVLEQHPKYIHFFAYPWGHFNAETDQVLKDMRLVPVLVTGNNNYNNDEYIDRLAIDGKMVNS